MAELYYEFKNEGKTYRVVFQESNFIESFRAETPGFSHGDEPGVIFV